MLLDSLLLAFGLMNTVAFAYLSYGYSFRIYGVYFNFEAFIVCSVLIFIRLFKDLNRILKWDSYDILVLDF